MMIQRLTDFVKIP